MQIPASLNFSVETEKKTALERLFGNHNFKDISAVLTKGHVTLSVFLQQKQ